MIVHTSVLFLSIKTLVVRENIRTEKCVEGVYQNKQCDKLTNVALDIFS